MSKKVVVVDVRDDIRSGREPFGRIMQAVAGLGAGQQLVLRAPFEPAPLYGVLNQRGFSHAAKTMENGDWEVTFARGAQEVCEDGGTGAMRSSGKAPGAPDAASEVVEVDARGLEPPQPLVKILEALATLPPGAQLRACTDRRPMHLYAQLEERGFSSDTEEQHDGSFVTYVSRR